MEKLQIIARELGLRLTKRGNGYHVNRGGYSVSVTFPNLRRVSTHLEKMKAQIDTK